MLTYLLALVVGLGSLALYLSAFFVPEVYRKGDLVWSGVGLFYALVLWVCTDRITGGVLLGQMASVSLIGWFGYQALSARLEQAPSTSALQAKVSEALNSENATKVVEQGKQIFATVRERAQGLLNKAQAGTTETPTAEPYQPLAREDFGNPPVTVDTESSAAAPAKPDVAGTIAGVGKAIGDIFKKPQKNTSTYVRKEFRDETPETKVAEETDDAFNFEEDIVASEQAVEAGTVSVDQNGTSDSTIDSDEFIQEEVAYEAQHTAAEAAPDELEPIPPNPPSAELIEAAKADAEAKHLPADPPEPTEES